MDGVSRSEALRYESLDELEHVTVLAKSDANRVVWDLNTGSDSVYFAFDVDYDFMTSELFLHQPPHLTGLLLLLYVVLPRSCCKWLLLLWLQGLTKEEAAGYISPLAGGRRLWARCCVKWNITAVVCVQDTFESGLQASTQRVDSSLPSSATCWVASTVCLYTQARAHPHNCKAAMNFSFDFQSIGFSEGHFYRLFWAKLTETLDRVETTSPNCFVLLCCQH